MQVDVCDVDLDRAAPGLHTVSDAHLTVARQWWLVIVLTAAATLGAMDRQVLSLLTNAIKASIGLTDTQVSLVYGAAFALANVAMLLPAGYLVDRFRRRGIMLAGVGIWSAMTVASGLATTYPHLLLARAGVGAGESVLNPAGISLLRAGVAPQRRGRAFAIYAMALMMGSALALIVGGVLLGFIHSSGWASLPLIGPVEPWQIVLVLLGLAGLPVALLLCTFTEPSRSGRAADGQGYRQGARLIGRKWRIFVPLLLFNSASGMIGMSYGAWIAPLLGRVWHVPIAQVGLNLGLIQLLVPPAGLWIVGNLLDRVATKHGAAGPAAVGVGIVLMVGVLAALVPLSPSMPVFWAAFGALMLVSSGAIPVANLIVSMITPPELIGKVAAFQYMLYGVLGAALGPTLVAIVGDRFFPTPGGIASALSVVTASYATVSFVACVALWAVLRSGIREPRP